MVDLNIPTKAERPINTNHNASQSPLLELTTLNIEIHFKTPSKTYPVRRSPTTQTGHAQTQVAGLAISSPLIITTLP